MQKTPLNANVFAGPDALKQFLDPDSNPPLPLVELPEVLNPLAEHKVRIYAKLLYLLPLLNLKSLPVLKMLQEASGKLEGVHTIVENSSGNTAFSLASMARLYGIRSVRAIVPIDIAPGKLELLRLAGADVRLSGRTMARIGRRMMPPFPWSPGRAVARTGLRMMPTFPPSSLKFRTAGFPQYGFKAGRSDGAFP